MITLGKAIYTILSGSTAVRSYVNTKIYPIIIPENTVLPCIVYERNSNVDYSRDGADLFTSVVDITILSNNYTEVINITSAVYTALNSYKGTVSGINIIDTRLNDIVETYAEESYIQKLTFTIRSY